ncbi:hypothetical protein [Kitasatospora sp. NBC_01539]|uniref:hypothetical protein n=1 Tax=Kitasatospora sp. NBC_01539 TaxID=2903577 RepID=UPI003860213C
MFIRKDPVTGLPVGTEAVFLTLGSALVSLFQHPEAADLNGPELAFKWLCLGCRTDSFGSTQRHTARDAANRHAADCRSIPWPATGDQG